MGLLNWLRPKPPETCLFAVDDVVPAAEPRATQPLGEALRKTVPNLACCSDADRPVLAGVHGHPLLAAVHTAYAEHRPLILSPDAVWITIAQGVARHMAIHSERLRSRFVSHPGRKTLKVFASGPEDAASERFWPEAFAGWAEGIREHVGGEVHDLLLCDFSTSGPVEQAASRVVMMDVFERYFEYHVSSICGIPTITLEGTVDDWRRLADKAAGLAAFDLDWWLAHLLPICRQFVDARRGQVDREHWRAICKLEDDYRGSVVNGWIAKLFPYLHAEDGGPCDVLNPIFETGEGFTTDRAPGGLSQVPIVWHDGPAGEEWKMEALGGLTGVEQDPNTSALRPVVGWAVRRAFGFDSALAKLAAEHRTAPGYRPPAAGAGGDPLYEVLPPDLQKFYHTTDGAEIAFSTGGTLRISALRELARADGLPEAFLSRYGRTWRRLATLDDGTWLAIDLDPIRRGPVPRDADDAPAQDVDSDEVHIGGDGSSDDWGTEADDEAPAACGESDGFADALDAPICCGADAPAAVPGGDPVVALHFKELLERLLNGGGRRYWEEPDFRCYGDAATLPRRP